MAAAGALGYLAEPSLRFSLTGIQPSAVENARNTKVVLQMPDGAPQIDVARLTRDQLPLRILLTTDVKVSDPASGVTMIIQAGNRVKLVRIERGNAVVSPSDGPFLGLVPITDTDLLQQIAANPPTSVTPPATPPTAVIPEQVPEPSEDSEDSESEMPEPTPAPEPATIPATPPAAENPSPTVAEGPTDAVKVMQDSIKAAQIKEFTFDQVLDWKAEADEIMDGETYQIGVVSYRAETIFGVKTIQAKALIKAGEVHRWIWPKSGMEIK